MKNILRSLIAALCIVSAPSFAQSTATPSVIGYLKTGGCPYGQTVCFVQYDSNTPLPIAGSITASLAGFTPDGTGAVNLAANGATPVHQALPTGTVMDVTNTGANDANVTLSVGTGTAASTDFTIKAGAAVGLTVGSNTFLNAVTTTGATVLNIKGGTGLVTGYGGGSSGGTNSNASVGTTGSTAPGSATLMGAVDGSGNLQAAVMPDAGNGTTGATTTQRVTLASDSTGQVKLASGTNLAGKVGIDQTTLGTTNGVSPVAAPLGGATPFHLISAASTNSTNVKNAAGTLYALYLVNTTSTIYYLRLYNLSSAPTCSSATGVTHNIPIPANTSGAGIAVPIGPNGEAYSTGIGYCLTGAFADNDNTNAATGVAINGSYN